MPPAPAPVDAPTWWSTVTLIGGVMGSAAMTVGSALATVATRAVHAAATAAAAATAPAPASAPATVASSVPPSSAVPPAAADAVPTDALAVAARLRGEAHALKSERDRHFAEGQSCFASGDGAGAKLASDRRKQTQLRIDQLRAQASDLLYAHYNEGRGLHEIDLHGLYIEEALAQLRRRIDAIEKRMRSPPTDAMPALTIPFMLVVIVGKGNHSRDNIAKLRPAVEELIRTHRLRVHLDQPNGGCLTVEVGSTQPAGWVDRLHTGMQDTCNIM